MEIIFHTYCESWYFNIFEAHVVITGVTSALLSEAWASFLNHAMSQSWIIVLLQNQRLFDGKSFSVCLVLTRVRCGGVFDQQTLQPMVEFLQDVRPVLIDFSHHVQSLVFIYKIIPSLLDHLFPSIYFYSIALCKCSLFHVCMCEIEGVCVCVCIPEVIRGM